MPALTFSSLKGSGRPWWDRVSPFWRAQLVGWSLFAVIDFAARQVNYRDLLVALVLTAIVDPLLVVLSAGLRRIYLWAGIARRTTFASAAWIALSSAVCAVAVVGVADAVRRPFGWSIPHWDSLQQWQLPVTFYFVVLAGWSLAFAWVTAEFAARSERQRAAQVEADALRAELARLRLQLEPHFTFNALNGIATEIPDNPDAALAMVRELAAYVRHSLAGSDEMVVSVAAEAAAVSAYLNVQKARFGDRLSVALSVDPGATERPIASFLLQPLVENAVEHSRGDGVRSVSVDVRARGDDLLVRIENPGRIGANGERDAAARPDGGVGLTNLRRRLDLHYPGRHRFSLSAEDERVTAALLLEGKPCSGA